MPTYAYECAACGHHFEEFQSMTAAPLRKCPECSKAKLRRLIGAGSGVIFKGSGFYQTDYKKTSGGEGKSDGESKKGEGKTESKASEGTKDSGGKPADAPKKASTPDAKPGKTE